jgi:hypothetical protein
MSVLRLGDCAQTGPEAVASIIPTTIAEQIEERFITVATEV